METNLTKLLEQKVAIKRGEVYYVIIEGKEIKLGSSFKKAKSKLKTLFESGKQEADSQASSKSSPDTSDTAPESKTKDLSEAQLTEDSATIENGHEESQGPESEKLATSSDNSTDNDELLGRLLDLETKDYGTGDMFVFIDGVDHMKFNNSVVKRCPYVFYWHRKKDNVNNGKSLSNNGWAVLSKSLDKAIIDQYKISTNRDDTPQEDFITVGENVLCVMRRVTYFIKKDNQRAKDGNLVALKTMQGRAELASKMGRETDPEKIVQSLASDNQQGRANMASQMEEQGASRQTTLQKIKALDSLEGAELANATDELIIQEGIAAQGF